MGTRAFRRLYPGLPKFSYFDDASLAASAERAANDARVRIINEHQRRESSDDEMSESSLEIAVCRNPHRGRGKCGAYTPGNLISNLAASAAAASSISAAESEQSVRSTVTSADAPASSALPASSAVP